jgi:hypothetical protein
MANSLTTDVAIAFSASGASIAPFRSNRRRRITPRAGHALEILGHAIDYLTDEFVHRGESLSPRSGELEAVQLLKAVNRQVYFECPEVVTVSDRLLSILHHHRAA